MSNPLLEMEGLPAFSQITPEIIEPAIDQLLAENREAVRRLLESGQQHDWKNLVEPLELHDDRLSRAWSPVSHMNSVINSDELRKAYNACLPKLSDYATEMGQNAALCDAYKTVAGNREGLDAAQNKLLDNALLDFHLSGVDLPPEKKQRYKEISQALSKLTTKFEENLLDATNAWSKLITDESQLAGLPDSAKALAAQTSRQRDHQ